MNEYKGTILIALIIIGIFSYFWVQTDQMMREMDKQHIQ